MKRIPKRSQLPKPDPIIISIDPTASKSQIVIPKVTYQIVTNVVAKSVFNGGILPLPRVLVYFLNHNELLVVSTIFEESGPDGECALTVKQIAKRLQLSTPSVSAALYNLRKIGVLLEVPNGKRGSGKNRMLNYKAIQHLDNLLENEAVGVYPRVRTATRKTNILNLTKADIKNAYDNQVANPEYGPEEEEEYD